MLSLRRKYRSRSVSCAVLMGHTKKAKALIDAGNIGRPVTFKSVGRDPFCPRPDYADPSQSGGLIFYMAIHDFDLARWLIGSEGERGSAGGTLLGWGQLKLRGDVYNRL